MGSVFGLNERGMRGQGVRQGWGHEWGDRWGWYQSRKVSVQLHWSNAAPGSRVGASLDDRAGGAGWGVGVAAVGVCSGEDVGDSKPSGRCSTLKHRHHALSMRITDKRCCCCFTSVAVLTEMGAHWIWKVLWEFTGLSSATPNSFLLLTLILTLYVSCKNWIVFPLKGFKMLQMKKSEQKNVAVQLIIDIMWHWRVERRKCFIVKWLETTNRTTAVFYYTAFKWNMKFHMFLANVLLLLDLIIDKRFTNMLRC